MFSQFRKLPFEFAAGRNNIRVRLSLKTHQFKTGKEGITSLLLRKFMRDPDTSFFLAYHPPPSAVLSDFITHGFGFTAGSYKWPQVVTVANVPLHHSPRTSILTVTGVLPPRGRPCLPALSVDLPPWGRPCLPASSADGRWCVTLRSDGPDVRLCLWP